MKGRCRFPFLAGLSSFITSSVSYFMGYLMCVAHRQALYYIQCISYEDDLTGWSAIRNYIHNIHELWWESHVNPSMYWWYLELPRYKGSRFPFESPVSFTPTFTRIQDSYEMHLIFFYLSVCVSLTVAQVCNGHAQLCGRKWSNISEIGTHDSAFVGDLPTQNQDIDVTAQLNAGVRFLQAQTHYFLGQLRLCHTSCWELNGS